ncbi:MAG: formate dehydrogenase accessory sulfurtransferase FdhD [Candidatus Latescibacterota bacterium]|nr:MAG: formate dehydrogenase accessory sulfurtransferase FdhD [Candidatus Latescibacterota bacterium]
MRKSLPVLRVDREDVNLTRDSVAEEFQLTIFLNDRELVTLACSPVHMEYLALGFLRSEGFIGGREDVERIVLDDRNGIIRITIKKRLDLDMPFRRLITSGCGRGLKYYRPSDVSLGEIRSDMKVSPSVIFELMKEFASSSETFKETGGVHSAAFCDAGGVLIFEEDIGRHNALDKVFGRCLWEGLPTQDGIVLTTGRVSSEVVLKAVRMGVPFLISRSAPTDLAVKLAEGLGLTLAGFVRGRRMNVYAHKERVIWETRSL